MIEHVSDSEHEGKARDIDDQCEVVTWDDRVDIAASMAVGLLADMVTEADFPIDCKLDAGLSLFNDGTLRAMFYVTHEGRTLATVVWAGRERWRFVSESN